MFEQNKTAHVEKDVVTLKNLETVKPVVEIESIKKSVEKNADAVHELQAKEQARNQDFLALFQKVTDLENRTQVLQHQMQESTEQGIIVFFEIYTHASPYLLSLISILGYVSVYFI